jgi:hypothetical protein
MVFFFVEMDWAVRGLVVLVLAASMALAFWHLRRTRKHDA